jgi:anti-anti-sigma factor
MPTDWSDDITMSDLADEPALSEELAGLAAMVERKGSKASHAVLNFSLVTYLNSSNLGQLLSIRKQLAACGRSVVLCGVSEDVMSIMRVTGLHRVFSFAPDPLTALAMLQLRGEVDS